MNFKTIILLVILILFLLFVGLYGNDLQDAIQKGDVAKVKTLISSNKELINLKSEKGQTPLHLAVQNGSQEIVEFLISQGADVNAAAQEGNIIITPMFAAIFLGHTDAVKLFLSRGGGDKNFREKPTGRTFLHIATLTGVKDLVTLFVNAGYDVNATDNGGKTPLHYAAQHGHKKIAELLIRNGARAKNLKENFGMSPLLKKKLEAKEATVWYLGTSGWAIKTKSKLLIFDYHACKQKDLKGPYTGEIDYLADKSDGVDLAFLPITGCGFRDPEAVKSGIYYALEKLIPDVVFPMHVLGFEYQYQEFARDAEMKATKIKFACAENKGDYFLYAKGKIKK